MKWEEKKEHPPELLLFVTLEQLHQGDLILLI